MLNTSVLKQKMVPTYLIVVTWKILLIIMSGFLCGEGSRFQPVCHHQVSLRDVINIIYEKNPKKTGLDLS